MKMYLIALFAFSAGTASGQIPGPDPTQTGTWADARPGQLQNRLRQPPSPPAGGFWVTEETPKHLAIVHFYADSQRELCTDTLRRKHLNLKSRMVVMQLNTRLHTLLDDQSAPASVAVRHP